MQKHRFYAPQSQIFDHQITLLADEAHHLAKVLRLGEGERVFVFDGEGAEWECEIVRVSKHETELASLRLLSDPVESPLHLTLAQALIKGDKFDWVVQKATELGVTRIVPLITEFSDIKRAEERAEKKMERWQRISLEALKQCGRRRLVEIAEPVSFAHFCESSLSPSLIFSEKGGRNLRQLAAALNQATRVNVCVASEGGWSNAELQKAETHNFIAVHLGQRILRTETAAIVAVALAQHLLGDLR